MHTNAVEMLRIAFRATAPGSAKNAPSRTVLLPKVLLLAPKDRRSIPPKPVISDEYGDCFHQDASSQAVLRYHNCSGKAVTGRSSHRYHAYHRVLLAAALTPLE